MPGDRVTDERCASMKLYYHPVSTVSRPVVQFALDSGIDLDYQLVDLMTGEHLKPAYETVNPSKLVPVLEDGDFRLTESSAILKYLADKVDSAAYPKDLKKRARVNEMMDWLNTGFYRDFGYGLVYPQIFPHHKRPTDEQHKGTIAWGKEKCKNAFAILDRDILGKNDYLANNTISIADYFGACIVTAGELIGCQFSDYPNVKRWIGNMQKLDSWAKVNEVMYGFAGSLKGQQFETV
jgi:glutathione S-transferase